MGALRPSAPAAVAGLPARPRCPENRAEDLAHRCGGVRTDLPLSLDPTAQKEVPYRTLIAPSR